MPSGPTYPGRPPNLDPTPTWCYGLAPELPPPSPSWDDDIIFPTTMLEAPLEGGFQQ